MLTFDKIKIVSPLQNIKVTEDTAFQKNIDKNGVLSSIKFQQLNPYLLYIEVSYIRQEIIVEFTGKILGKNYQQLINQQTIQLCFEAINNLGFCRLNVDAMMCADVVKCDVTVDIDCTDVPSLTTRIRGNISNFQKYVCRLLRNGNFVVEKNVTTRQAKKRLTIYDKAKEMSSAANQKFTQQYPPLDFDNKCRFELNLNSKGQIRNSLNLTSTTLLSVLQADACPIRDFLDEILVDDTDTVNYDTNDAKTYFKWLLIKECNYDVVQVEAKLRALYNSKGTNIRKVMLPYRKLLATLKSVDVSSFKAGLLGRFYEIIIFIIIAPCLC